MKRKFCKKHQFGDWEEIEEKMSTSYEGFKGITDFRRECKNCPHALFKRVINNYKKSDKEDLEW